MATKKKDAKITASSHSFFPILFCVTGRKKKFFFIRKTAYLIYASTLSLEWQQINKCLQHDLDVIRQNL